MDAVIRGAVVYVILFVLFRLAGRRTIAQITMFDFVLLLIISEAVQNGMVNNDFSVTNAFLLVLTLITIDIGLSFWKERSKRMEKILDDVPTLVVDHGHPLKDRMEHLRIDEDDVLEQARYQMGLERMDQVKYAVVERNGHISIIPTEEARWGHA